MVHQVDLVEITTENRPCFQAHLLSHDLLSRRVQKVLWGYLLAIFCSNQNQTNHCTIHLLTSLMHKDLIRLEHQM